MSGILFSSRYLALLAALLCMQVRAQYLDLSLGGFPVELVADFQSLSGYSEVEFRELYIRKGDTLMPEQLVRRSVYEKNVLKEQYEKHNYATNYVLEPTYIEKVQKNFAPDNYSFSYFQRPHHPTDSFSGAEARTHRYRKNGSGYVDEFFYNNGKLYAKKQSVSTTVSKNTYKLTNKEWRNDSLILKKDTLYTWSSKPVRAEEEPRRRSCDLEEGGLPQRPSGAPMHSADFSYDRQQRPYQYQVIDWGTYAQEKHAIYKFLYHGDAPHAYRIDYFLSQYASAFPETPDGVLFLENYVGTIPTLITYISERFDEKRIVWITLKK